MHQRRRVRATRDAECGTAVMFLFFFFQAEDGIRDYKVTGVQTCALPILSTTCCDSFKFVSWNESQQVVDMEANNDYWDGAPNIKQLRVRVILDANTQQAELRSGRVDLAINTSLSPDAYVALAKDPNLQVTQSPGTNVQWLGLNTQSAPLTDARVRQAIAYAIDRASISKNLLQGQARVAHSMGPPES